MNNIFLNDPILGGSSFDSKIAELQQAQQQVEMQKRMYEQQIAQQPTQQPKSQSTRMDRASTYFSSCEVRNLSNSMSAISQTAFSAFS